MKYRFLSTFAIILAILALPGRTFSMGHPGMTPDARTSKTAGFREDMRKLWEDHITWTRLYIVSALADLPDKDATATRLLQNQTDIGNAIKPFYGNGAGDALTALLKDHILIAADLIAAVKAGDTTKSNAASARWDANADAIAKFLAGANPHRWGEQEMKTMMHEHLSATTAEVVARLKHDWAGDVSAYENVHHQILGMADMLSSGIIAQFPGKFK